MEAAPGLPRPTDLTPSILRFLADEFRAAEDLSKSADLESGIRDRCANLEAVLDDLGRRLSEAVAAYASHAGEVEGLLGRVREGLIDLRASVSESSQGVGEGDRSERSERILLEELPALAKEVARVETVRAYAETALKLDSLIGDVEDTVSSSVAGKLRTHNAVNSEETRQMAISFLKDIEDILISVTKTRPQWTRLVAAVDHRVDRALAVLRPQAIADHRSLLVSLGWPPPLTGSNLLNTNSSKTAELSNPLFSMRGDLKSKYSDSFLSLCCLQELQRRRKARQLEGYNLETLIRQPLWVIEELVNPIAVAAQRHFSKWVEKPEFVFALVYKITRDFVDSMDEILQPLVDKARLVGYSCREEWISGMVTALSLYLSKEVFPKYVDLLQESTSHARVTWLNLVDLMISFDKRTRALITNAGLLMSLKEDENLPRISALSVFCDRPDWLEVWAEIEKGEILDKVKLAMQNEKSWITRIRGAVLISGSDDYNSPAISGAVLQGVSLLIDRARPLPSIMLRARFIRLAPASILMEFADCMLHRCQEAEGLTALADDDALIKVSQCINAARYCESNLMQWCEDVFFLEMEALPPEFGGKCIFDEEINKLKEFRVEWVDKISTVILRGFDARSRDYLKNKKQWQDKSEELAVSRIIVGSLDYLQGKISKLEEHINALDFITMWRTVADGVDQLLFNGILMSGAKFYNGGVERLGGDLNVLFGVFAAWCLRPEGFFPKLYESFRILRMDESALKEGMSKAKERWLKENGIRRLNIVEVEKIMKSRVFL
ncbi:RINT1-like protein MAG2 [Ananas comosus]|uniref:RINT1-like protein MAG2 n=1 Tax=Ananas comosus TaxID=4615 RepID=A0A6P5F878_ANACO|nr:RINT1-like protein MAG2 [Ananas comosus]